jgi:hypothetical protein
MKYTGILAAAVLSAMFSGYALSVLWAWFIMPQFGLSALSVSNAIGLSMTVRYLTHQDSTTENRGYVEGFALAFMQPALVLFFGWIVTFFL